MMFSKVKGTPVKGIGPFSGFCAPGSSFGCMLMIFILLAGACLAQETGRFHPEHNVGINIGHEHSFHGIDEDGDSKTSILPYWGIDYNFRFARKFSFGLHIDLVLETFEVEKNLEKAETVVTRTRPVAPALMGFYKPTEHWSFGLGMGAELAKEESFVLNRAAVEYGVEIRKGWEVYGVFQYDIRWKAYDTWTIGLGIGKTFGKNKRNSDE
ncbi:hypothetical protein [Chitinophaga barathri]|nr:hypothetical protein [Chitinophaga barathri]